MSKLDWLTQEIDGLKEQGLYNRIRTIGSAQGAWLTVDGKNVLNFCSNNYLGLANHPKIVEAAQEATKKYGVGPARVRCGTTDLHVQLNSVSPNSRREDVITFQSGHRQPWYHLCAREQRGCDLFRSSQPCLDHRWLPALGRQDRSLRTQ
jgi:glycine C-acetyltransferase